MTGFRPWQQSPMRPPYGFGGMPQQRNRPSLPRTGLSSNQQRMGGNRMGMQNRTGVNQTTQQQVPRTQPQYKMTPTARNQPGMQVHQQSLV